MFSVIYFVNAMDEALGEDRVRKRNEQRPKEKKIERKVTPVAPKNEKIRIDGRDPNHHPEKPKAAVRKQTVTEADDFYEDDPTLGWAIDYKA